VEWPEDREKFTKEDLAAFAAQKEKERLRQLQAGRSVYADLYDDGSQPAAPVPTSSNVILYRNYIDVCYNSQRKKTRKKIERRYHQQWMLNVQLLNHHVELVALQLPTLVLL
jgi:hypothetical protein